MGHISRTDGKGQQVHSTRRQTSSHHVCLGMQSCVVPPYLQCQSGVVLQQLRPGGLAKVREGQREGSSRQCARRVAGAGQVQQAELQEEAASSNSKVLHFRCHQLHTCEWIRLGSQA